MKGAVYLAHVGDNIEELKRLPEFGDKLFYLLHDEDIKILPKVVA